MIVLLFSQVVATFLRRRRPMEPATGTESGRGDQHNNIVKTSFAF